METVVILYYIIMVKDQSRGQTVTVKITEMTWLIVIIAQPF